MARVHNNGYQVVDSIKYAEIEFGISRKENSDGTKLFITWFSEDGIHCLDIHEHSSFEMAEKYLLFCVCHFIKDREGLTHDLCAPRLHKADKRPSCLLSEG